MPKFSSWRERGAARRTARQAPAATDTPKLRGSRDTKRWCRGKIGIEHKPVVRTRNELGKVSWDSNRPLRKQWVIRYCSECGKELDHYYPIGPMIKDPPEWAKVFFAERGE